MAVAAAGDLMHHLGTAGLAGVLLLHGRKLEYSQSVPQCHGLHVRTRYADWLALLLLPRVS